MRSFWLSGALGALSVACGAVILLCVRRPSADGTRKAS